MLMKQGENVCISLYQREYGGSISPYRRNLKIFRKLVLQKDAKFKKMFEKHSGYPITFERDRLYLNQHRICYAIHGHGGIPQKIYELPSCPVSQKIVEPLVMDHAYLDELPLLHNGYKPSFLALTAHNWLMRYDLDTGEELQRVYLSTFCKFRRILPETECERFTLKSVHQKNSRLGASSLNVLMTIALFTIFPLEFTGMLEIEKKIFGKDITDVMLSHSLLLIMHQRGKISIHSLEEVLANGKLYTAKLGQFIPDHGIVGSAGVGLPINIKLKECPAVLFEVKCADHNLQMGGNPWHYIISPHGHSGVFKTYALKDDQLAKNGVLESSIYSVEAERAIFHPDDSGRILHIIAHEIKIYSIKEDALDGFYSIKNCFSIYASGRDAYTDTTAEPETVTTSSGRVVRRQIYRADEVECDYDSIQGIDYENELDILAVTAVNQHGDACQGMVRFHDNANGALLKEIVLDEPWNQFHDHVIGVDMDTVVHIVKGPMKKFSCYIYKLDRSGATEKVAPRKKSRSRSSRPVPRSGR
ncbi:DDB1- and CUL4-associated factor 17-like isoform X2 [Lineus longissimus]|uniref:DDB1- and CUL4-associated factor 17-like isoform X2 n=1 Tax=Lineus longissimus TaxID=88925 RepID=UPI002B4C54D6